MDEDSARRRVAELGEFFAVEPADAEGEWLPVADLLGGSALAERVRTTEAALVRRAGTAVEPRTTVEPRAAASTASLGLFARLVSPAVGSAVLGVPGPAPDALQWRPVPSGTLPLRATAWTDGALRPMLDDVVEPLVERFVTDHGLPDAVVRGNAASAAVTATRMATLERPDLGPTAARVADELLATTLLAGTDHQRRPFVRRSCCLYYRIPGGGYCGDCILLTR